LRVESADFMVFGDKNGFEAVVGVFFGLKFIGKSLGDFDLLVFLLFCAFEDFELFFVLFFLLVDFFKFFEEFLVLVFNEGNLVFEALAHEEVLATIRVVLFELVMLFFEFFDVIDCKEVLFVEFGGAFVIGRLAAFEGFELVFEEG
jgi:hypothetical protein